MDELLLTETQIIAYIIIPSIIALWLLREWFEALEKYNNKKYKRKCCKITKRDLQVYNWDAVVRDVNNTADFF